jgi:hypothetical protein
MKSNLVSWLLICAAVVFLVAAGRADLLAIVAPVSIVISFVATRRLTSGNTGPRRI